MHTVAVILIDVALVAIAAGVALAPATRDRFAVHRPEVAPRGFVDGPRGVLVDAGALPREDRPDGGGSPGEAIEPRRAFVLAACSGAPDPRRRRRARADVPRR